MSGTQDYPRLSNEAREKVVKALQESGYGYGHFNNLVTQRGPYVVAGYFRLLGNGQRMILHGAGPVVVDTRDYSVARYGSLPDSWPDWLGNDDYYPSRRVKLAPEPFPAQPPSVES